DSATSAMDAVDGARDEFHLAAIAQNLKTLALRLIRRHQSTPARELRASIGGVSVEAAPARARPKTPISPTFARSNRQPIPDGSRGRLFFDSIGHEEPRNGSASTRRGSL